MFKSLKFKAIISSVACILIVGICSNIYLYHYLTRIISEKAESLNRLNLETVQARLNQSLEEFTSLGNICAYDLEVARGMRVHIMDSPEEKRKVLNAQEMMQKYMGAHNGIESYISRLMVFNEYGIRAQAVTREWNGMNDTELVMQTEIFQELSESGKRQQVTVGTSIVDGKECLIFLGRIYEPPATIPRGWIYIEMNSEFIGDVLAPYAEESLFVLTQEGLSFPEYTSGLEEPAIAEEIWENGEMHINGRIFKFQSVPLRSAGLMLYSKADITDLSSDAKTILYTTVVVMITSLSAAIILAVLLGNIITKPLNRLTGRLRRISGNELYRDPSIEEGSGEIAEMGRVVNEMVDNINTLLRETEEMHIRQKNDEIALLQSQVNPHFLYNTLDSIRWLAVIQKNPGIEKTVRSLSNLLKNLAKGVGDKITVEEEISLLHDYVDTQSVRFMELLIIENHIPTEFLHYQIIKFTLQPLVENAIFHGIEPTGECGTITLDAREEGEYLLITVEDNGIGMSPEEVVKLRETARNPHPGGMAGIGVANVDSRLKLVYGEECGLLFESEQGKFTRVTVRIRKEAGDV